MILENAFQKALDRDLQRINFLKQSQNQAYLERFIPDMKNWKDVSN